MMHTNVNSNVIYTAHLVVKKQDYQTRVLDDNSCIIEVPCLVDELLAKDVIVEGEDPNTKANITIRSGGWWNEAPRLTLQNPTNQGSFVDFWDSNIGNPHIWRHYHRYNRYEIMYAQVPTPDDMVHLAGNTLSPLMITHTNLTDFDISFPESLPPSATGTDLIVVNDTIRYKVSAAVYKENIQNWDIDESLLMNLQLKEWTMIADGTVGHGLIADDVAVQYPAAAVNSQKPCRCTNEYIYEQACENPECGWSEPTLMTYDKDFILWALVKDYQTRNAV
jgi:hypothetical protein